MTVKGADEDDRESEKPEAMMKFDCPSAAITRVYLGKGTIKLKSCLYEV